MTVKRNILKKISLIIAFIVITSGINAQLQGMGLQNEPVDVSNDFNSFKNTYYLANEVASFDPATGKGELIYNRYEYKSRQAFNNMLGKLVPVDANEFPEVEYAASPKLPFQVDFVSDRTIRLIATSGFEVNPSEESLMLVNGKANDDRSAWSYSKIDGGHKYTSQHGSVVISIKPFHLAIFDAKGKQLTSTLHINDVSESTYTPIMPFAYVRKVADYSRSFNAVFKLSSGEKIFGCGESFTKLDKRGQKIVLWTDDANGIENETMYKPIPFFMSNKGYGIFMHTSTPITCDFGKYYDEATQLMIGDDKLDLFLFLGEPKDILDQYTNLTGKASMPPLWSFGLWMSRITYFSEADGRNVASLLRKHKIPSDVIHFDTGWFETDWRCDYKFASSRFDDAGKMISDLKKDGFNICLWQLPYFVPKNSLFPEIVDKGLYVKDAKGGVPYEDAVLDFSNPATVDWYQEKIGNLLKMGVGAIKVDFGEAAPANGIYHSGKTGYYEHNLYPLRYNKAVADITKQVKGENIIWARSAWAGSQRFPLHWGGDAANTNNAMHAELRGGLSFGASGFSFWSHDVGGFVLKTPADLYQRWLAFGMLTSHSRCHGMPPKEPWEYGEEFTDQFRKTVNLKYELMPYVYAQAKQCTEKGLPMVRALFIEFPNDPGSWLIDDEYLFGSDILVAPLFEDKISSRDVYLPKGTWIDYQTGQIYEGGWHNIAVGNIPAVILVKEGSVIPHIKLAQSTSQMNWNNIDLKTYISSSRSAKGLICLPDDNELKEIEITQSNNKLQIVSDPYSGKTNFNILTNN
ncbi:MAG: alpha-xylosidase [Marinilabiliaceae bacterium]|nr:alpha-xylosidase [Marinilabiliaceae bacterium]